MLDLKQLESKLDEALEQETEESLKDFLNRNRCSDYDCDCKKVSDPHKCWIGGTRTINGKTYHTPPADGYCPLIHDSN